METNHEKKIVLLDNRNLPESIKTPQSIETITAQIAHEIRNPLNGMKLFVSMLSKRVKSDPESSRLLENLRIGIRDMERCVSNCLVCGNLPAPEHKLFHLYGMILEITEFIRPMAKKSGIRTSTKVPNSIELFGDRHMMKQVFLNLAMNSVQAMPNGGEFTISVGKGRGDMLNINFSDSGVGIAKKNIGRVFEPFFTTKANGTGLGLSVSQKIISAHDGKISVNSPRGKKGSTFRIELKGSRWKKAPGY